ncbi:unnamed protein product, partial [Didymodactylos carnosus]
MELRTNRPDRNSGFWTTLYKMHVPVLSLLAVTDAPHLASRTIRESSLRSLVPHLQDFLLSGVRSNKKGDLRSNEFLISG